MGNGENRLIESVSAYTFAQLKGPPANQPDGPLSWSGASGDRSTTTLLRGSGRQNVDNNPVPLGAIYKNRIVSQTIGSCI
jgi:hypothetical protein